MPWREGWRNSSGSARLWSKSEQTLVQLSQEIGKLQSSEDQFSEEIEQQQRIQWELEQKLEHLADCKTRPKP